MAAAAEHEDAEPETDECGVFRDAEPRARRYNRPGLIVSVGSYYSVNRVMDASGALRYLRETGEDTGYSAATSSVPSVREMRDAVRWTRWINALNDGRKWPLKRFFEILDPLLEPGIAIAVVPSHDPFQDSPPIRELARLLAASNDRIDATGVLVRHTKIKRIVWGGPSYRALHEQTITVTDEAGRVRDRAVLLLDDIARSGASLRACENLLYQRAGARLVQSLALGRVAAMDAPQ